MISDMINMKVSKQKRIIIFASKANYFHSNTSPLSFHCPPYYYHYFLKVIQDVLGQKNYNLVAKIIEPWEEASSWVPSQDHLPNPLRDFMSPLLLLSIIIVFHHCTSPLHFSMLSPHLFPLNEQRDCLASATVSPIMNSL